MKKVIEIHAAEGGEDSSLFVKDLAQTYTKTFQRIG
jgi:protein subunit release factor A